MPVSSSVKATTAAPCYATSSKHALHLFVFPRVRVYERSRWRSGRGTSHRGAPSVGFHAAVVASFRFLREFAATGGVDSFTCKRRFAMVSSFIER